ncbi:MAG: DUF951 domain-containing protein [Ezakiella sp.]|nr:DUF951 domain-containing protein [Ezakiella sp.]MDD7471344.1 DUF951 domain-containing protein [Bacillota bacterium]MDY3923561.1 DUF951 domain-containing protein [Ezakiella sp.]
MLKILEGDIVTMKKPHPCGKNEWKVLKTGVDMKIICMGCNREIIISRFDFYGRVRKVLIDGRFESVRTTKEFEGR